MLCTIRVTDGGFICSASARSPSEGFFSFSTETSIEAWAGEMPPSDEWRRRRFSLVMAGATGPQFRSSSSFPLVHLTK